MSQANNPSTIISTERVFSVTCRRVSVEQDKEVDGFAHELCEVTQSGAAVWGRPNDGNCL